jgi:hypothetical protein
VFFRRGATDRDDPWLTAKLWVFTLGAVAALTGMLLENGWIMALGAALLAAGILLRFVPRRGRGAGEPGEGGEPGA